jgi:hypothetical protein
VVKNKTQLVVHLKFLPIRLLKIVAENVRTRYSWIYGTEGIVGRLLEVMNLVWRVERFSVDWREGVIILFTKRAIKIK